MMKSVLIISVILLSLGTAQAAKTKKAPKMSKADAQELCITSKGANMKAKILKKCVSKAMRTGKV